MRAICVLLPILIAAGTCGCGTEPGADVFADPATSVPPRPAITTDDVRPPDAQPAGPRSLPADAASLARSANAFGLDLYAKVRTSPGNLAVSPASAWLALAMAAAGAQGDTAADMTRALRLGEPPARAAARIGELQDALSSPAGSVTLRIANRLFGEQRYRFEQPYLSLTASAFHAPLEPVDFRAGADQARRHINDWVATQTEQRIKDLIPGGGVDSNTRLVLVNAVYFLGQWATGFAKDATRLAPFRLASGDTKQVPTMHQHAMLRAGAAPGIRLVELPYRGHELAMTIVVPEQANGLGDVEQALDLAQLDDWIGRLHRAEVELALPRFVIDPATSLALGEALASLGMRRAFDPNAADFTAIADPPEPSQRIFFSEVFHKGFVAVDEVGTEAAAATAIVMTEGAAAEPERVTIAVERPFLFFIRHLRTGLVLFQGRVTDPSVTG